MSSTPLKRFKVEVFIMAETESDAIERIEDLDRDDEFDGYGKTEEVKE